MSTQGDDETGIPAEISEDEMEETANEVSEKSEPPHETSLDVLAPNEPSLDVPAPTETSLDILAPTEPSLDVPAPTEASLDILAPTEPSFPAFTEISDDEFPIILNLEEKPEEPIYHEIPSHTVTSDDIEESEGSIEELGADQREVQVLHVEHKPMLFYDRMVDKVVIPDVVRQNLSIVQTSPTRSKTMVDTIFGTKSLRELGLDEFLLADISDEVLTDSSSAELLVGQKTHTNLLREQPELTHPSEVEEVSEEPSIPEEMEVLQADNPMMAKFQLILRNHLLKQKERLLGQLTELDSDLRKADEDIKKIGETVAIEMKITSKQEETIKNLKRNIKLTSEERNKLNAINEDENIKNKSLKEKLKEKQNEVKSLDQEKCMMLELVNKLDTYKECQDDQLKVSKMQTEKNKGDMKKMLEQKQKQDLVIWRMTQLILDMKRNYDDTERNILTIKQTADEIANNINTAEVDARALKLENDLIRLSLNKSFEVITARNQAYPIAKKNLQYVKDSYANAVTMLCSVNKKFVEIRKEESTNRIKLEKLSNESNNAKASLLKMSTRTESYETYYASLQPVLEYNENRVEAVKKEANNIQKEMEKIAKKMNGELEVHNELNNILLTRMNSSNLADGTKCRINAKIKQLAKMARQQEVTMAEVENKLAKQMLDNEMLKAGNLDIVKQTQDLNNAVGEISEQVKEQERRIRDLKFKSQHIKTKVTVQVKKIDAMTRKDSENEGYLNPLEVRIKSLETELLSIHGEHENLENNWIKLQNNVLNKGELRNKLINDVLHLRKDYSNTEHFRLKGEEKIAELLFSTKKCQKNIQYSHKQLEKLEFECTEKGRLKEELSKLAFVHERKYEEDLKAAEKECMAMQRYNMDLEECNEESTARVKELQRELLEWDKKIKMAAREKDKFQKEMQSSGEIGAMKLEIHRMQIRLSQLKKAQDKIMIDLEHCIGRRDSIIEAAEAREIRHRVGAGKVVSKFQIDKKIVDMKMRLKQAKKCSYETVNEIKGAKDEQDRIQEDVDLLKKQVGVLRDGLKQIEQQIYEGQIHKHACLEMTVLRQRKARFLEDLKFGRYKNVHKNDPALLTEEVKQSSIHSALEEVLDSLKADFPHLGLQIIQIMNSLKHPEKLK